MQMRLWLQHLNEIKAPICRAWSHPGRAEWARRPFAHVSRLGNGVFWYSLVAVLPVADGCDGLVAGLHMLVTGGRRCSSTSPSKGRPAANGPANRWPTSRLWSHPSTTTAFPPGTLCTR